MLSPEDLILYWKSRNFYHLSPKDPFLGLKTPQIFIYNMSPKHATENSFIFVTKRPLTLSPKDPYFLNAWCTSLYTNRVPPGYLHPLSILSLSTSVSPTEVLHRFIMQGQRPSDTRRAVCMQSFPRQLYSRTHNARLKFRNKCTSSIATGLQKP